MQQGGIDHQAVSATAPLPIQICLHQSPEEIVY